MTNRPIPAPLPPSSIHIHPSSASAPLWSRISAWAAEHKAVVYTIAGVTVVATAAGVYYYHAESKGSAGRQADGPTAAGTQKAKKDRRKAKANKDRGSGEDTEAGAERKSQGEKPAAQKASVESEKEEEELPVVTEESVAGLTDDQRKEYAAKFKAAGNRAYGQKDCDRAIALYSQAILCKAMDPVFYANRAACWNSLKSWDKVVEDTTAALKLDPDYVKALNRRGNAYEELGQFGEALLDYTASCILDGFRNDQASNSVERLLKKVAEAKSKVIMQKKTKKLPSPTFMANHLQSFRPKPLPEGLGPGVEIEEESGLGQLRKGLNAVGKKTADGYAEASDCFDRAVELGNLGEYEGLAYNMRGTFRFLKGENAEALADLTTSIKLQPSLTQSYIKRASMHLEMADPDAAAQDFALAMAQNPDDPDIFYHRAQLHFILGEFDDAAKDYQRSIDLDRDFIFSHIQLGVTQYKMGSIASSMATFRRCMKNFDKAPDVYNYYGELLFDQQKYQEAIEKFDTAVDMERSRGAEQGQVMNVLPLINKALALFRWRQDFAEAESLCQKALIIDPECDIAVATMAQLLLQQGKVTDALEYFERAAELSRTEGEVINALSYAEATRTQLDVQTKYPRLAQKLQQMGGPPPGAMAAMR